MMKSNQIKAKETDKKQSKLFSRLDALKDGTLETDCLVETLKDVLRRYLFVSAYVAANRSAPDWPDLAVELLSEEDCWPSSTDPDVLALFSKEREKEFAYRAKREQQHKHRARKT